MREPVVTVRRAGEQESEQVRALLDAASPRTTGLRGATDLAREVVLASGTWLVAETGGTLVGAALVDLVGRTRPTMLCVAVHPGARGIGVGTALLEEFRRQVREAGGTAVDAYALPGDRETKNLYERAGIAARMIIASGPA